MDFIYTVNVPGQMRQWIADAIRRANYPWDAIPATVTFDVQAEPPVPGHKDVMCTEGDSGAYIVTIRAGVDQPDGWVAQTLPNPASDIRIFFGECVIHEMGHVVQRETVTTTEQLEAMVALVERVGVMGEGRPVGEPDDWYDEDFPWEDNISEAVAEIFKDIALDSRYRIYDDRTNWELIRANFGTFLAMLSPPGGGFWDDFSADRLADYDVQAFANPPIVADGVLNTDGEDGGLIIADAAGVVIPLRASMKVTPTHAGEGDWIGVGIATAGGAWYVTAKLHTGPVGGWHLGMWHSVTGPPPPDPDATEPPSPCWLTLDWDGATSYTAGLWYTEPPADYGVGMADRVLGPLVLGAPPGPVFPVLFLDSSVTLDDWRTTSEGVAVAWEAPWPYEDPTISGGQGASGVMRFAHG